MSSHGLSPARLLGAALPPSARARLAPAPLARRAALLELRARGAPGAATLAHRVRHDLPSAVRLACEWDGEPTRALEVDRLEPERRATIARTLLGLHLASLRAPEGLFVDLRLDAFAQAVGTPRLRWSPAPAWYRLGHGFRETVLALCAHAAGHASPSLELPGATGTLLANATGGAPLPHAGGTCAQCARFCAWPGEGGRDGASAGLARALAELAAHAEREGARLRPDLAVLVVARATLAGALDALDARPDPASVLREVYP